MINSIDGSQTQNYTRAALRRKMSPLASDLSKKRLCGPHRGDQNQEMLHNMLN